MKNIAMLLTLFSVFAAGKNLSAQGKGAEITFEKEIHDFGNVKVGANTTYQFRFTNTGDAPLFISAAKGSCNCTVPFWPKDPVNPGASAEITVKYNSSHPGPIAKSVTISSNAVNDPNKIIRIKGNVTQPTENPTPINNAGPGNH